LELSGPVQVCIGIALFTFYLRGVTNIDDKPNSTAGCTPKSEILTSNTSITLYCVVGMYQYVPLHRSYTI